MTLKAFSGIRIQDSRISKADEEKTLEAGTFRA